MKRFFLLILTGMFFASCSVTDDSDEEKSQLPQCSADSLLYFVKRQTDFGARVPNSAAHDSCRNYIVKTFERYGANVTIQSADLPAHDHSLLHSSNIIASFNPSATERVFVSSHYDSRPWCDEDDAKQPVMGANDGASGVAVLLELARLIGQDTTFTAGVDLICFDSEDYGVSAVENSFCLGSQYWAKQTLKNGYKARYGILLDMVGSPDAKFYREQVSDHFAKRYVDNIWREAEEAGFSSLFVNEEGGAITDDHYYVNVIAGIPCIDIIDYVPGRGFPETWHTTRDVYDNISKETLKAVCTVIVESLSR